MAPAVLLDLKPERVLRKGFIPATAQWVRKGRLDGQASMPSKLGDWVIAYALPD